MPRLDQVFGISTLPVMSYVARPDVDGTFISALNSHPHIVIYGASKQGKTALRQRNLNESQCVTYRCGLKSTATSIYQHVLKEAGIRIEASEVRTDTFKAGVKGSWSFRAVLPYLGGANATGEASSEGSHARSRTLTFVETDVGDAQIIATLLKSAEFDKFIVIENFHYLTAEVQKTLSVDLKTFHETGIRFIILGVWREANHLFIFNPDLQDRVVEVPVEPWEDTDFDRVISEGENHLNIRVAETAKRKFKENAFGNVGLLQEFLKVYCRRCKVEETCIDQRDLVAGAAIEETLAEKADDQRVRLLTVLEGISTKSRPERRVGREDPLTLPYYLVQVLLTAPIGELVAGISRPHLLEHIRRIHRRADKNSIRVNDVVHLMKRLPALQAENPSPFLYYANEHLKIADAGLLFALARIDRESLREEILDPLETYDDAIAPLDPIVEPGAPDDSNGRV